MFHMAGYEMFTTENELLDVLIQNVDIGEKLIHL